MSGVLSLSFRRKDLAYQHPSDLLVGQGALSGHNMTITCESTNQEVLNKALIKFIINAPAGTRHSMTRTYEPHIKMKGNATRGGRAPCLQRSPTCQAMTCQVPTNVARALSAAAGPTGPIGCRMHCAPPTELAKMDAPVAVERGLPVDVARTTTPIGQSRPPQTSELTKV